ESRWLSSPFGPFTATLPGATSTVTESGTAIGFLPILLIRFLGGCSPDVGDNLAADALLLRFVTGHHPGRGADDRGSGAAVDPRHLGVVDVAPATRARDPLHPRDDGAAVLGVLEADPDRLADPGGLAREVADIPLLLEDPRHLDLQPRSGDLDLVVAGPE